MNQSLLNPFATPAIPESVHQVIAPQTDTACLCARFNPRGLFAGQYVAAARADCAVAIYDLETRSRVRYLEGHVRPVTSLDWTSTGRFLVSGSMDWNVVLWDLKETTSAKCRKRTVRFEAAVSQVTFAPGTSKVLLVVLESQQAIVVDLRRRRKRRVPVPAQGEAGPSKWQAMEVKLDLAQAKTQSADEAEDVDASSSIPPITTALFHPSGAYIVAATTRGEILVFSFHDSSTPSSTPTCRLVARANVSGSSAIREMAFDRSGRSIVVNSNDRCIRVVAIDVPSASASASADPTNANANNVSISTVHRFQDLVNRTPWNGIGFSGDGEYVYAGAAHQAAHNLYIWDRGSGILDKILEGPREPLVDADWHPVRPLILSVNVSGSLNVWFTPNAENWSAYAPGFEELEENVEYEEGEEEFDLEDEDEVKRREHDEEEGEVDVLTVVGAPAPANGAASVFARGRRAVAAAAVVGSGGGKDEQDLGLDDEKGQGEGEAEDAQWEYGWAPDEELDGDDFALHVVLDDLQAEDYRNEDGM